MSTDIERRVVVLGIREWILLGCWMGLSEKLTDVKRADLTLLALSSFLFWLGAITLRLILARNFHLHISSTYFFVALVVLVPVFTEVILFFIILVFKVGLVEVVL